MASRAHTLTSPESGTAFNAAEAPGSPHRRYSIVTSCSRVMSASGSVQSEIPQAAAHSCELEYQSAPASVSTPSARASDVQNMARLNSASGANCPGATPRISPAELTNSTASKNQSASDTSANTAAGSLCSGSGSGSTRRGRLHQLGTKSTSPTTVTTSPAP